MDPKWEKFCVNFVKHGNAAEAYRQAGYSCKTTKIASASASRLLKSATIQERLKELQREMTSPDIADAIEVQERLTRILRRFETDDHVVVVRGEPQVITKRPSLKEVLKAGELLARMQGALESGYQINLPPVFIGADELE